MRRKSPYFSSSVFAMGDTIVSRYISTLPSCLLKCSTCVFRPDQPGQVFAFSIVCDGEVNSKTGIMHASHNRQRTYQFHCRLSVVFRRKDRLQKTSDVTFCKLSADVSRVLEKMFGLWVVQLFRYLIQCVPVGACRQVSTCTCITPGMWVLYRLRLVMSYISSTFFAPACVHLISARLFT